EIDKMAPPTSSRLRFILPFSSSKTRRPDALSAILAMTASSSLSRQPTNIKKPASIFPVYSPSTLQDAYFTRWINTLMSVFLLLQQDHALGQHPFFPADKAQLLPSGRFDGNLSDAAVQAMGDVLPHLHDVRCHLRPFDHDE